MTHEEMIALIEAHRDGKTIQYRLTPTAQWRDRTLSGIDFNFAEIEYRIKPTEPVTAFGVIDEGELFLFHHEEEAKADVARNGGRIIKLIEEL
jgi:hypothetical protein